jgi:dinuclear metal center YbgI/SA1388 family protein
MNLFTLVEGIAERLPPETAMKGDKIGLQLQSRRTVISKVMTTMEVTDAVALEAVGRGADCIVAFHPLLFAPLAALVEHERVGRLVSFLIRHEIALIVAHTNFDTFPRGTSALFAEHLGFRVEQTLVPDSVHKGFGMGVVACTPQPLSEQEIVALVHERVHAPVRFGRGRSSSTSEPTIERVAIVGGSGASFFDNAVAAGADAFITADIKYHDFHRAEGMILLVDPGHYEMEQWVSRGLESVVLDVAAQHPESPIEVFRSALVPNPVRYYPEPERYKTAQQRLL